MLVIQSFFAKLFINMFNARSWKFVGGFLAIIALALAGLAVSDYFFNPERKAAREYREYERQYEEDTYGGTTPEETLELFISALEAGDIELASKYFVVEERAGVLSDLKISVDQNKLNQVIEKLRKLKLSSKDQSTAFFNIVGDDNVVLSQANLIRGPNGLWKIIDM